MMLAKRLQWFLLTSLKFISTLVLKAKNLKKMGIMQAMIKKWLTLSKKEIQRLWMMMMKTTVMMMMMMMMKMAVMMW